MKHGTLNTEGSDTLTPNQRSPGEKLQLLNDFYVHASKYDNTWGCVRVKDGQMPKVLDTYKNSSGPKFLTIDSYSK